MYRKLFGTDHFVRFIFVAGFTLISVFVLCDCGGKPESNVPDTVAPVEVSQKDKADPEVPVEGDWLVWRLRGEPKTLNTITARDAYEFYVNLGTVYEALLTRDNATLKLKPSLAESYSISEDHLEYTFKLRQDVKFHDGVPFTANDIAFTFDRINDPKVDAAHLKHYFRDVKSLEVIDDYTVKFTYSEPYWKAIYTLGFMPIIPKHIFEKGDFNNHPNGRHPLGTGPYKFLKWETGQQIVLERNDDYWGEKVYLDRIVFKIVTDSTASLQLLKRGDVDLLDDIRAEQWVRQLKGPQIDKNIRKITYYQPEYSYIGWNSKRPYFEDKMVRRAMTHLIDRETIRVNIKYGLAKTVTGSWYVNSPEYDSSIKPWPHDPAEAVRLLDEAGWKDSDDDGIRDKDGVPFRFEFLISSGSVFAEQLSTILKEDLKKVGVDMTIRKLEWATFEQKVTDRDYDATTMRWKLVPEADPYQIWHSSQAEKGSNFVGFVNAEADDIIERSRREFDEEKRWTMFKRFHAIMHEEQPYTFLFCSESLEALDKRFANVEVYPLGLDLLEWYVPKALQKRGVATLVD
ncbi:peptide-binding protein [Candidatus Hydrogenedentota bacterium]